jgi:hypothetical protein
MRISDYITQKESLEGIEGSDAVQWTMDRADELYEEIRAADEGMTRTQIQTFFSRNASAPTIAAVLSLLAWSGRAERVIERGGIGRPVERWRVKSDD